MAGDGSSRCRIRSGFVFQSLMMMVADGPAAAVVRVTVQRILNKSKRMTTIQLDKNWILILYLRPEISISLEIEHLC